MKKLAEGEEKRTDLPTGAVMVQKCTFGKHTLAIEKLGVEVVKLNVMEFPSWEAAFEKAMDKAGL